ncbi:MAG TPA: hypothetical protein VMT82_09485 [candidate division Zixibacteria bacterium]|nr:hypothetical protein [candidate division Zixibacteria bacterium]
MKRVQILLLAIMVALTSGSAWADSKSKLSDAERKELIRAFLSENCFVHRTFPMGKTGLEIDQGKVLPSDAEVRGLAQQYGAAARPGDRARITEVKFLRTGIVFELNGGPVKRKKWYDRLEVGGLGAAPVGATTGKPVDDVYNNAHGSYVLLKFKDGVPSLTPDQVKEMLLPVLDFKAQTVAEAYQKSLPPFLQQAVKDHRALVGMDKEMVTYALGRPPKRTRERDEKGEYEEWIYGEPPQEVQFIRFHGDTATRIETMRVDGEKIVRNENEVGDLSQILSAAAKKDEEQAQQAAVATRPAPTLARPGEVPIVSNPQAPQKMPPLADPNGTQGGNSPTPQ